MESARKVAETVWIGALIFIAAFMSWTMWHDRGVGPLFAQHLFPAASFTGMVLGVFLLFHQLWALGFRSLQTLPFWILLLMWLFAIAIWIGLPRLLGMVGVHAAFAAWHGLGMLLYLLQCILGIVLVVQRR
ncbi:hypothetical protein [Leeia oryzae]|uniref:hypothetical protein n=1 Tax=Leeia oryzae TaxID=356662 RepID=UPI000382C5A5|nr:hypothetical protein [Leeia oryzae]